MSFFFSSRRRHTRSVSAFLLNRSSDLNKTTNLTSKEAKMGKVMRHTLGASLNIRHNLSSSKGPKPLQLKLLTTYIPKTSAFTLAFSTSQRLRTTRARSEERFSRNAETDLVCRLLLEKKKNRSRRTWCSHVEAARPNGC